MSRGTHTAPRPPDAARTRRVARRRAADEPGTARPGGIRIRAARAGDRRRPSVTLGERPVLVYRDGDAWRAAVGVSLAKRPRARSRCWRTAAAIRIPVSAHAYREERLTVQNPDHVSPDTEQLARIARERNIIDAALVAYRDVELDGIVLSTPVSGPRSSSFGLKRFFNDQPRSPHKGMDIAAAEGTLVASAACGPGQRYR